MGAKGHVFVNKDHSEIVRCQRPVRSQYLEVGVATPLKTLGYLHFDTVSKAPRVSPACLTRYTLPSEVHLRVKGLSGESVRSHGSTTVAVNRKREMFASSLVPETLLLLVTIASPLPKITSPSATHGDCDWTEREMARCQGPGDARVKGGTSGRK